MARCPKAVTIIALILVAGLGVVGCGNFSVFGLLGGTPPTSVNAVLDQQIVRLETTPASGTPEIPEAQAIALARSYLPSQGTTPGIQTRFVTVTLRDTDGAVVRGVQSQPAWLITLTGFGYRPPGTANSVCACSSAYDRPSTMAALDAHTGKLIALLGVEN